jgi:hypothetical protein
MVDVEGDHTGGNADEEEVHAHLWLSRPSRVVVRGDGWRSPLGAAIKERGGDLEDFLVADFLWIFGFRVRRGGGS